MICRRFMALAAAEHRFGIFPASPLGHIEYWIPYMSHGFDGAAGAVLGSEYEASTLSLLLQRIIERIRHT